MAVAAPQQQHSLRPPAPPSFLPLGPASSFVPGPPLFHRRGARALLASRRPSPSPRPPLPMKRVAATGLGEEDGKMVLDEETESEDHGEEPREYLESVGAGLPARLRASRAEPAGDSVFFLLTAVAVTVRRTPSCSAQSGSLFFWFLGLSSFGLTAILRSWSILPRVFWVQTFMAFMRMVAVAIPTMLVSPAQTLLA
jgi:hypothetical protein